jgi:hypothetical protein
MCEVIGKCQAGPSGVYSLSNKFERRQRYFPSGIWLNEQCWGTKIDIKYKLKILPISSLFIQHNIKSLLCTKKVLHGSDTVISKCQSPSLIDLTV